MNLKPYEIHNIDGTYCKAGKGLTKHIFACLQYADTDWYQGRHGMIGKEKTKSLLDRRGNKFLVGLLPRVEKYLTANKIKHKITGFKPERLKPEKKPNIKGIKLRPDQKRLIQTAVRQHRGVIISPTGSGKTVLIMGIMSMFPKAKILFLCHTLDLIKQTYDEFKEKGFKNIQVISGEQEKVISKKSRIVIATIQSYSSIHNEDYFDLFDITFIDESHHVQDAKSQYGEVLSKCLSPIKIGVTATLPNTHKGKLILEGMLGPVIGELTIEEGMKRGVIVKPKVTLIPVTKSNKLASKHKKYNKIYEHCIVNNRSRNTSIVKETLKRTKQGKTVLVMVKEIDHGNNLVELGRKMKLNFHFVRGLTPSKMRVEVKNLLNKKKIKAVISTAIWREGLNIPTLDCVINACSGKSDVLTLQIPGRGLRTAKGKTFVEVIDFADPYRFLAEHAISRIQIYLKNDWL